MHILIHFYTTEGFYQIIFAFSPSCSSRSFGNLFNTRMLLLLLLLGYAALLWIVSGFRRLKVIDIVHITHRLLLLLHLNRVHNRLGNYCLLLLSLWFQSETFCLRKVQNLIPLLRRLGTSTWKKILMKHLFLDVLLRLFRAQAHPLLRFSLGDCSAIRTDGLHTSRRN